MRSQGIDLLWTCWEIYSGLLLGLERYVGRVKSFPPAGDVEKKMAKCCGTDDQRGWAMVRNPSKFGKLA
jgi:hypothetical protein